MASKTDSTKVLWRVQYRLARKRAWKNAGLFETRSTARGEGINYRMGYYGKPECGFGNSRVLRHVRGGGR